MISDLYIEFDELHHAGIEPSNLDAVLDYASAHGLMLVASAIRRFPASYLAIATEYFAEGVAA